MAFLEKPQGYWYWFKEAVRMCFPMKKDFHQLGTVLWEALCKTVHVTLICISRLLLLASSPVSVPIIALLFTKANKATMEQRAKWLTEGFPAQYTREEVDSVLKGEKTLEQLEKEKEAKWNS